jgi:transcriptional repressor NrdR
MGKLADLVNLIESLLFESPDREISTTQIGEELMTSLKALDKIAYVRFASVYRDFQDVDEFLRELNSISSTRKI